MMESNAGPSGVFGKRRPPAAGGAPRPAMAAQAAKPSGAAGETDAARQARFVPTKLAPILLAGILLVVVQLLVGEIVGLNARPPGAVAYPRPFTAQDVTTLFAARSVILPLLLALIYQGCHLAAMYSMGAHIVLRWLKFSSLAAYAVGGLCASFVYVSWAAVMGDHLEARTCAIELLGGALAGLLYRLFAGVTLVGAEVGKAARLG